MGEAEFTDEELEILGEEKEETGQETGAETKGEVEEKTEEAGEEAESATAEEAEVEEEPDKVQKRIDQLTARSKTAEEKLDLLKTDPKEYYRQYPDEAPEPQEEKPPQPANFASMKNARVRAPGQPIDGMTLGEIYDEDPFMAIDLYNRYTDSIRTENQNKVDAIKQNETETLNEITGFQNHLTKELFQATADSLTEDQAAKIGDIIQGTIDWMKENGRTNYNILDAYQLMTGPQKIASAKSAAVQKVLKAIESAPVASVSNKGDAGVKSGFGKYLGMNADQFGDAIADMPDSEFTKLMKDAPPELKKKFPSAPWD